MSFSSSMFLVVTHEGLLDRKDSKQLIASTHSYIYTITSNNIFHFNLKIWTSTTNLYLSIFILIPLLFFLYLFWLWLGCFCPSVLAYGFRGVIIFSFPLAKASTFASSFSRLSGGGSSDTFWQWYSHTVKQMCLPTCRQQTQIFELFESISIQNTAVFLNNSCYEWIQIGLRFEVDVQSLLLICTLICLEEGRPGGGVVQTSPDKTKHSKYFCTGVTIATWFHPCVKSELHSGPRSTRRQSRVDYQLYYCVSWKSDQKNPIFLNIGNYIPRGKAE